MHSEFPFNRAVLGLSALVSVQLRFEMYVAEY